MVLMGTMRVEGLMGCSFDRIHGVDGNHEG